MPTQVTKEKKSLPLNSKTRKEKSHYSGHFFAFEKPRPYFGISICNSSEKQRSLCEESTTRSLYQGCLTFDVPV